MNPIKTVSVCGLGKLGSCIAATLAARGFEVVGVDIDPEKVNKINEGLAPLDEPLLAETIRAGHSRLRATLDPRETVATDATFFIPPSPSLPDGSFSNEFLLKAMQPVAKAMRDAGKKKHLFVCSSTTTPGAIDAVLIPMLERELGGICGQDFSVCYNPEFIALGDVINGLLEPDLVLIGESDPQSGAALEQLYKTYNRNSPRIARMSIISAELTKISLNSYITMKISFTNQLRLIAARHPQADIHAILDALGSDSRIGKKYLRAGFELWRPLFPARQPSAGLHCPAGRPGSAAGRGFGPGERANQAGAGRESTVKWPGRAIRLRFSALRTSRTRISPRKRPDFFWRSSSNGAATAFSSMTSLQPRPILRAFTSSSRFPTGRNSKPIPVWG